MKFVFVCFQLFLQVLQTCQSSDWRHLRSQHKVRGVVDESSNLICQVPFPSHLIIFLPVKKNEKEYVANLTERFVFRERIQLADVVKDEEISRIDQCRNNCERFVLPLLIQRVSPLSPWN